jgi:hypothetical protein
LKTRHVFCRGRGTRWCGSARCVRSSSSSGDSVRQTKLRKKEREDADWKPFSSDLPRQYKEKKPHGENTVGFCLGIAGANVYSRFDLAAEHAWIVDNITCNRPNVPTLDASGMASTLACWCENRDFVLHWLFLVRSKRPFVKTGSGQISHTRKVQTHTRDVVAVVFVAALTPISSGAACFRIRM